MLASRRGSACTCHCCRPRRATSSRRGTGFIRAPSMRGCGNAVRSWSGDATASTIDRPGHRPHTSAMARKPSEEPSPVADFEASLDQLEQLVDKMEHGEMSLEESLAAYERGVGLYRRCQTALEQAELRVRLLSDPDNPAR